MAHITAEEIHNQRVIEQLQARICNMEEWTEEQTRRLRMTTPVRRAAEQAYRQVICARRYLLVPRHTTLQRRFLQMILMLAVATDSNLASQAARVARYLSHNYIYEWCTSPITARARNTARDMILRAADSPFHETPYAPHLAYVMFHHDEVGITNVSDYTEMYTQALALDHESFFRDLDRAERQDLGLHLHPHIRETRLAPDQ